MKHREAHFENRMEYARVSYYYYDTELDKVHAFFQKYMHLDNEIYTAVLNRVGEGLR